MVSPVNLLILTPEEMVDVNLSPLYSESALIKISLKEVMKIY